MDALFPPTDGSNTYVINGEAIAQEVAKALMCDELPETMTLKFTEDGKTTLSHFKSKAERMAFVKGLLFGLIW